MNVVEAHAAPPAMLRDMAIALGGDASDSNGNAGPFPLEYCWLVLNQTMAAAAGTGG